MCITESDLVAIGAFQGECPFKPWCKQDLPADKCELVATCEALDPTTRPEISLIPQELIEEWKSKGI